MKKVAIIMGSDSDLPTAEKAATELKKLEIPHVQRPAQCGQADHHFFR